MAKKKSNRSGKKRAYDTTSSVPKAVTRRSAMGYLQYGILGLVVAGGIGGYVVTSVMASVAEQDLTAIGAGLPTVVQIHDPACSECVTLQRQARSVLDELDDDLVAYRVANLASTDGLEFAREHGVGRVTLMLFDADGSVVDVMTGPQSESVLERRFLALIEGAE